MADPTARWRERYSSVVVVVVLPLFVFLVPLFVPLLAAFLMALVASFMWGFWPHFGGAADETEQRIH